MVKPLPGPQRLLTDFDADRSIDGLSIVAALKAAVACESEKDVGVQSVDLCARRQRRLSDALCRGRTER